MSTQPVPRVEALEPAGRRMIEATNTEDSDAFLDQFAEHAVVDDFGRRFVGRAGIAAWNARENIGTHNRITVTDVRSDDAGIVLTVEVTGDGYNGGGTFVITMGSDVIEQLVIRG